MSLSSLQSISSSLASDIYDRKVQANTTPSEHCNFLQGMKTNELDNESKSIDLGWVKKDDGYYDRYEATNNEFNMFYCNDCNGIWYHDLPSV